MILSLDVLTLDAAAEAEDIEQRIQRSVLDVFRRRGVVVGVSGGVDSATVLALATAALGANRVLALALPEKDSSPESVLLAQQVAQQFGVTLITEDITPALEGLGCYRRRDEAVRRILPDYDPSRDRMKIVLPSALREGQRLNLFSLVVIRDGVEILRAALPRSVYNAIVAATNMKQRSRMSMLYYHAELRDYIVLGTANLNEYEQGFFVKYGDGGADIQPIQHLYKTQVYQLAAHLHVPEEIISRTPTTDTYSAECSQEEFFFRLPFRDMDLIWYASKHKIPACETALALGLTLEQVENVYRDLGQKEAATEYLRTKPLMFGLNNQRQ